jgi:hypothetical protein
MAKKTACPVSRRQFKDKAQSVQVTINDKTWTARPREFATGSLGWNLNEKMEVVIDGVAVTVQVGLNLTLVGSKDLPPDPSAPTAESSAPAPSGPADA